MNEAVFIRDGEPVRNADTASTVPARFSVSRALGVGGVITGGLIIGLVLGSIAALFFGLIALC